MNKNNKAGRSKAGLTATLAAGMMLASEMSNKPGLGNPGNRPIASHPVSRAERESPPAKPRRRKRVVKRDRGQQND